MEFGSGPPMPWIIYYTTFMSIHGDDVIAEY